MIWNPRTETMWERQQAGLPPARFLGGRAAPHVHEESHRDRFVGPDRLGSLHIFLPSSAGRYSASTTISARYSSGSGRHALESAPLEESLPTFTHCEIDIRDRAAHPPASWRRSRPDLVVNAAAQPSHDLAAQDSVRRFRHQRGRHAEHARGNAAFRAPKRPSSIFPRTRSMATLPTNRHGRASDALGLRRSGFRHRHRREVSGSISRSTRCSAHRKSPPT